jgi:hypothetical protein
MAGSPKAMNLGTGRCMLRFKLDLLKMKELLTTPTYLHFNILDLFEDYWLEEWITPEINSGFKASTGEKLEMFYFHSFSIPISNFMRCTSSLLSAFSVLAPPPRLARATMNPALSF